MSVVVVLDMKCWNLVNPAVVADLYTHTPSLKVLSNYVVPRPWFSLWLLVQRNEIQPSTCLYSVAVLVDVHCTRQIHSSRILNPLTLDKILLKIAGYNDDI
jgi:hypothetical protein